MSATQQSVGLASTSSGVRHRAPATFAVPLAGFAVLPVLGFAVAAFPSATGWILAVSGLVLVTVKQVNRIRIEPWQFLALFCVSGYAVLNYGFDNLCVPLGPLRYLPIAELLMGVALVLAVLRYGSLELNRVLHMRSVQCVLALLALTIIRLVIDVPRNGLYALRDSTSSFEGLFLALGALWTVEQRNIEVLKKWLLWLFIVASAYSFTFPWAEEIQSWSPSFGPFHAVHLFGNYQEVAIFLLSGALFSIWVAPAVVAWPRWVFRALAILQLAGLAILQSRTMFVGVVLIACLLVFLRERNMLSRLLATVGYALGALVMILALFSVAGWKVQGRLGPMDVSTLADEVKSIWPSSTESKQLGHESDRKAWYGEVFNKLTASPVNVLLGVGFGEPLVDFMSDTGQPIRQPHNSSLTFLGRLGLIGLVIWSLFLFTLISRLWRAARQGKKRTEAADPFRLWFLTFVILGLLDSMVQPYFEFSHCAVPFFFLAGIALGNAHKTAIAASRLSPSYWGAVQRQNLGMLP